MYKDFESTLENLKYLEEGASDERLIAIKIYEIKLRENFSAIPFSRNYRKEFSQITKALTAMEKYGDNKWWKSPDKRIVAYYQLKEPILIANGINSEEDYIHLFEILLKRHIHHQELRYCKDNIIEEAEERYKELIS